jgi:hypothetical protein
LEISALDWIAPGPFVLIAVIVVGIFVLDMRERMLANEKINREEREEKRARRSSRKGTRL